MRAGAWLVLYWSSTALHCTAPIQVDCETLEKLKEEGGAGLKSLDSNTDLDSSSRRVSGCLEHLCLPGRVSGVVVGDFSAKSRASESFQASKGLRGDFVVLRWALQQHRWLQGAHIAPHRGSNARSCLREQSAVSEGRRGS